jgi:beta-lactamase regulating signal transducer with metallopeptidase domain
MNTSLAWFEAVADMWTGALARASWQGGLAVIGVWAFLRMAPRIPARIQCWLWRLVFLKLLMSLLWATPIDIPILTAARATSALNAEGASPGNALRPVFASIAARGHVDEPAGWRPSAAFFAGWLLGLGASAVAVARGWQSARGFERLHRRQDEDAWRSVCCQDLCRRLGLRRVPQLVVGGDGAGPMVIGAIRPAVFIPAATLTESMPDQIRLMLAHELAHISRRDLAWNWLATAVQALFFFHPLVWFARREWRMAQESACDALAIEVTGATAADYGRVLLNAALQRPPGRALCPAAVGMSESYHSLKRRLSSMRNLKRVSRRRLRISALAVAVIGTSLIVPWRLTVRGAAAQEPAGESAPAATPPTTLSVAGPGFGSPQPVNFVQIVVMAGKELKLSAKQSKRLEEILDLRQRGMEDLFDAAKRAQPATSVPVAMLQEIDAVADGAILQVMDRRQKARMSQIKLQVEGPLAFFQPEVQSKLNLNPSQIEAIGELVTRGREEIRKAGLVTLSPSEAEAAKTTGLKSDDAPDLQEKMAESRRSALKAGRATMQGIGKILSKRQLATYRVMLGEAYDVTNIGGLPFTNPKGEIDPAFQRKPAAPVAPGGALRGRILEH